MTLLVAGLTCIAQDVIDTTMGEVGANPAKFDGKLIRVRAMYSVGFEHSLLSGCKVSMWYTAREMPFLRSGEVAAIEKIEDIKSPDKLKWRKLPPRIDISFDDDDGTKAFNRTIEEERHRRRTTKRDLWEPVRVTATFVGRLDWLGGYRIAYRAEGSKEIVVLRGGFGHLNGSSMQFVVYRISDVETTSQ